MATQVIRNGTLIDGRGGPPVPDAVVVLDGERIAQAGPAGSVTVPAGATTLDAGGGFVLPGFIDAHVHLMMEIGDVRDLMTTPFALNFYQAITYMRRTLDAGVTSVRDAAGADAGVKAAVEQGLVVGPRMQISITALSITGGHGDGWLPSGMTLSLGQPYPGRPDGICDGPEGVRKKVREVLRAGAEIIKVCSTGGVMSPTDHPEFTQFTFEELAIMVQEGRARRGVKVMAHAQGAEGIKNALRAGIHSIEHGIYIDDEAIELFLETGAFLVPTLVAPVSVIEAAERNQSVPEYGLRKAREVLEAHKASIAKAYRAGVKIAMGTDSGVGPHGTNLRELGLMCDIGMSPMEAIVATTKVAAECLGWEDRVGTVEAGKLADIVIARADPLERIRALEDTNNIAVVLKGGQVVKDLRAAAPA
ncbi:MAG TPA: amidohydrolase family protein [Thermomicrobiales bacterium]|nr:amidohydrolase family protein [Thermomicrobiales bacterium]